MKILGIDPGLAILGWSVVDVSGPAPRLLDYGCIRTAEKQPLTKRLTQIFSDLNALIEEFEPVEMAIETLFFLKNAKALAQVGHTRGIILLAAGHAKIDVFEYAPRQVKMALTGFGGADKKQMQAMVQRVLSLKSLPTPDDAADAVAIALCHGQYARSAARSVVTV